MAAKTRLSRRLRRSQVRLVLQALEALYRRA